MLSEVVLSSVAGETPCASIGLVLMHTPYVVIKVFVVFVQQ